MQCFWSGPDATLSDVTLSDATRTNSSDMDVPYTTKNSSDTTNSSDLDVSYASGNSSDSDSSGLNAYTDFNTSEFENSTTSTTHNFNKTTDTYGNETNESIIVTEATECSNKDDDMTNGSTVTEADMTYSGSSSGGSACCADDVVELCFTLALTILGGEGQGEIFCNITCGDLHNSSGTISYHIISKEGV